MSKSQLTLETQLESRLQTLRLSITQVEQELSREQKEVLNYQHALRDAIKTRDTEILNFQGIKDRVQQLDTLIAAEKGVSTGTLQTKKTVKDPLSHLSVDERAVRNQRYFQAILDGAVPTNINQEERKLWLQFLEQCKLVSSNCQFPIEWRAHPADNLHKIHEAFSEQFRKWIKLGKPVSLSSTAVLKTEPEIASPLPTIKQENKSSYREEGKEEKQIPSASFTPFQSVSSSSSASSSSSSSSSLVKPLATSGPSPPLAAPASSSSSGAPSTVVPLPLLPVLPSSSTPLAAPALSSSSGAPSTVVPLPSLPVLSSTTPPVTITHTPSKADNSLNEVKNWKKKVFPLFLDQFELVSPNTKQAAEFYTDLLYHRIPFDLNLQNLIQNAESNVGDKNVAKKLDQYLDKLVNDAMNLRDSLSNAEAYNESKWFLNRKSKQELDLLGNLAWSAFIRNAISEADMTILESMAKTNKHATQFEKWLQTLKRQYDYIRQLLLASSSFQTREEVFQILKQWAEQDASLYPMINNILEDYNDNFDSEDITDLASQHQSVIEQLHTRLSS